MSAHRVVAIVQDGLSVLDLAAPAHFFGHLGGRDGMYEFTVASAGSRPVTTSSGFDVAAEHGLAAVAAADTIVVCGYGSIDRVPDDELLDALRDAARSGRRVMSICSGAFTLAHAGLLDGRRATTHWSGAAELAARFPAVVVDPDVLFVDEGAILTSAGVAAGIDLCLHVVRRDHGAAIAARFARMAVVAPHRDGGQAQFVDLPLPDARDGDESVAATRAWALERLDQSLDVATLARYALVSPRTFARRFKGETGTTPHRWLTQQRILAARRMLRGHRRVDQRDRVALRLRDRGRAADQLPQADRHDAERLSSYVRRVRRGRWAPARRSRGMTSRPLRTIL